MVRPWKELSSAMTSNFSGWMARPCACAILSAPSTASVPVLAKNARARPLASARRLRQRSLVLVIVKIGAVNQQAGLLANDFQNARMSVTERVDADAGEEIEIAAAFQIVNIAALSARQNERITGVVLQEILALQLLNLLRGLVNGGRKDAGHLIIITDRRGKSARLCGTP